MGTEQASVVLFTKDCFSLPSGAEVDELIISVTTPSLAIVENLFPIRLIKPTLVNIILGLHPVPRTFNKSCQLKLLNLCVFWTFKTPQQNFPHESNTYTWQIGKCSVFFFKLSLHLVSPRDKIENYTESNIYSGSKLDDRREKENFLKYESNRTCLFDSAYWYGYVSHSIKYHKL